MTTPSSAGYLERGQACLRCRRRKVRCDGSRPACGQCVRADRQDDCEYADPSGPTTTQMLEQRMSQLQTRIAELESQKSVPLELHDPYERFRASRNDSSGQQALSPVNVPADVSQAMLQSFSQHSSEFGFFLNGARFLQRINPRQSASRPQHLTLLLNTIYLMAVDVYADPGWKAQQPAFLGNVLQELPNAMSLADASNIMDVLQAEVLLAYYFLNSNRQLEGAYHLNAAVSIVMACKLNILRSAHPQIAGGVGLGAIEYRLSPPADDIEEGERINAFWTVFSLERIWAVTLGTASAFTDDDSMGTQIDIPWPLDMAGYQNRRLSPDLRGTRTIQAFLRNPASDSNASMLSLYAKSTILFYQATQLARRWNPDDRGYQSEFRRFDGYLERYKQSLPPVDRVGPGRADITRSLLVIHSLAHCATIQLHMPTSRDWSSSVRVITAALSAARNIQIANLDAVPFINPIVGASLTIIAQTLGRGIAMRAAVPGRTNTGPDEGTLNAALNAIITAFRRWSGGSLYLRHQLSLLR
ncbi:hypothetical protein OBBRIDRAFT_229314 [Obba rivulosa]|uniref:Zn(2)-C6 fungal-type domain-containing protein n=1 Tax=Obba rivulosa TaxID=1052685 RepID=A0A8E2DV88_9APHY|nr:hypothetical protein OBBRIDRAFT_229314 [Obba rivulosa]